MMNILMPVVLLSACVEDESIAKYADSDAEYQLTELDGTPFTATATISFPEAGKVTGQAPCNRYFADQSEAYPWFNVGAVRTTRMACPDLDTEAEFIAALRAMTLAEVAGETLILSNLDGRQMVFVAR